MPSGYAKQTETTNMAAMAIIFHFRAFFTVKWPSPKKRGAVTAAEGTKEAKFATIAIVMQTAVALMAVPVTTGIQMLKNSIIDTELETKFVMNRHRK